MQKTTCTCDGCGVEIKGGDLFVPIQVPIPRALRGELVEYTQKEILNDPDAMRDIMPPSIFGLQSNLTADSLVPRVWPLHYCIGCVLGVIPGIVDRIREQARAAMLQSVEAKRRKRAGFDELDESVATFER